MPGIRREPGTSDLDDRTVLKLLLDQNISLRLMEELDAVYPGSKQVKQLDLDQADDATL